MRGDLQAFQVKFSGSLGFKWIYSELHEEHSESKGPQLQEGRQSHEDLKEVRGKQGITTTA